MVHCERALRLHQEADGQRGQAITLDSLGYARHADGDHDAARQSWRQACTILTDLEHPDAATVRAKLTATEWPLWARRRRARLPWT